MRVNYAIVFVSDMSRSIAFYRDVFGLPLRFESPSWTEFATEGATLALHTSKEAPAEERDAGSEPPGSCRTGFEVPDLEEFHQRMLAQGVPCVQNPTEVFGSRVAEYRDADGLSLSIGEAHSG